MDADLVAHGGSCGSRSADGAPAMARTVTVGFVNEGGGCLVAANTGSEWGENLLADPDCRVRIGDRSFEPIAEPLEGADHARAVRELILRYGTPSEGLGRGPSFRLVPLRQDRG